MVVDCMAIRRGASDAAGTNSHHQLLRLVRGEAGCVRMRLGSPPVRLRTHHPAPRDAGGRHRCRLRRRRRPRAPVRAAPYPGRGMRLRRGAELAAGEKSSLRSPTRCPTGWKPTGRAATGCGNASRRPVGSGWTGRAPAPTKARTATRVLRSTLVLKALTNTPPVPSSPLRPCRCRRSSGGVRNWDYRYSWLRDAALNLYTLFSLGYTEEAHAFMAWVERTTAGRAEGSADHVRRGRRAPPPRDRARCPRRVQELEPDAHRQRCCRAVHSTSTPTSSTPPGSTTAPAGRSPLPSGACSPGW